MRKLFSAATAVSLLLASLLVLQPTANAQTQAARSAPLYLDNTEAVSSSLAGKQVVNVSVKPVNNCQPKADSIIDGGDYTLQPQGTNTGANDQIVGQLDSLCNYEITYADASGQCPVNVSLIDEDGNGVGAVISNQRPISVNVDYNNGDITANGSGAFVRVHFAIDRSDSNACGTTFAPRVDITIPTGTGYTAAGKSVYENAVIDVEFSPVATGSAGCETVKAQMSVTAQGNVVWKAAVAGQAASAPNLVHISRAEIERSGSDIGCRYVASFSPALAGTNLVLQTTGLKTDVRSRGNADASIRVDRAEAVYAVKTVAVSVVAVFPDDAVFTTKDRVSVEVAVAAPCGGTIAALPAGLWKLSDSNSAQIFPGDVYLYGSSLNAISNVGKSYSLPAFNDPRGTQRCSVVAEVSLVGDAGRRCSSGETSQTKKYEGGNNDLSFKFSFICNSAVAETSETSETETPPALPSIVTSETSASEVTGPLPEGRTG